MQIRRYSKEIAFIVISFTLVLLLARQISYQNKIIEEYATGDTLSAYIMIEDFEYTLKRLEKIHPKTVNGFTQEQRAIIKGIRQAIKTPMKRNEFYFLVNRLFHTFHDAHTNMWPSWKRGIPVALLWLQDGLFIEYDSEYLRRGDKIITIGGKNKRELFEDMKSIVCGENDHYVRQMGQGMIISITYLDYANLIEADSVSFVLERERQEIEIKLPLIELGPRPKAKEYEWISYTIDEENDLAVLELNECIFDQTYKSTVKTFFEEVSRNDIDNVVLDLRQNVGGNSSVINEFLRYLDIEGYKWYGGDIRHSEYASEKKNAWGLGYELNPRSIMRNKKVADENLLFTGRLFALTSKKTFSSANMFAVTLKDNNLAEIIGEPTGNSPTCYGDPMDFKMPNTQILFRVSYKYFPRPKPQFDPENTLTPDIEVRMKQADLIYDTDPQIAAVIEMIKS